MGRLQNAFLKRQVKKDSTFTSEQKDVLYEAIDKHGQYGLQWLVDEVNGTYWIGGSHYRDGFQLTADQMREILKYMDRIKDDLLLLSATNNLGKVGILFVATVYNQLFENETSVDCNYKQRGSFNYYEEKLFNTFFKITTAVDAINSKEGSKFIENTLSTVKDTLIEPFLHFGFNSSFCFSLEALDEILQACRDNTNPLRLLDDRYTPEQMKLIRHAMLNRVSEETLNKMCNPDLTVQEMFDIEYGKTPLFKLNSLVVDDQGRRGRVVECNLENKNYHVLFVDPENIGADGWYDEKCLSDYEENKQLLSVDNLISRATAISEETKGLADDLKKLKDSFEINV